MSDPAPADPDAPLPLRKSLRGKGLIGTLVLLAYVLGSVFYISGERARIYDSIQALDQLAQHEKALALAEAAVNGAVVDVNESSNAALPQPALPSEIALYMESCDKLFRALEPFDPGYALLQRAIERSYHALEAQPMRANWIDLREALVRASADLEIRHRRLAEQRDALTAGYRRQYDAVTVESLLLSLVGIAVFGAMAAWFFARLAGDVRRLEAHARQIVRGTRGIALDVKRDDELGHLMQAVNRMAVDLDEREKQIEVDSQRRSHQDKMLAVGALAAGIAHEVNNPLAVIAGAAQELRTAPGTVTAQALDDSVQLILAQAERAARAARQLADIAAPAAAAEDWIDVNAMLRRVVQLTGYDKRYRQIRIELALDPALPAVRTTGTSLQQVLMQMLAIAGDALVDARVSPAVLEVVTIPSPQQIVIELRMPPAIDFARAEVQRAMLLCRAIIEPLRGRLAFGQGSGDTLAFKLTLPADTGSDEG